MSSLFLVLISVVLLKTGRNRESIRCNAFSMLLALFMAWFWFDAQAEGGWFSWLDLACGDLFSLSLFTIAVLAVNLILILANCAVDFHHPQSAENSAIF